MSEVPRARLQREWVLCALAAAAARFVPVPLLDDLIAERAVRTAVTRTWQAHGRPRSPRTIDVLCDEARGFWFGVATSAARLPVTLLLYPFRKIARLVTAVRGVSRDLAGVLLLARSVDRCLAAGWFAGTDQEQLRQQAVLVRRAHDRAVAGADLRLLRHGLAAALRHTTGLRGQAPRFARDVFGRRDLGRGDGDRAPIDPQAAAVAPGVEAGVRQVEAVLARPDVTSLLAALDERFDRNLAALTRPRLLRP